MRIRSVLTKVATIVAIPALAFGMSGCAKDNADSNTKSTTAASEDAKDTDEGKKLQIFATTGYIADAVKNIAPEAEVYTMVKPGGDPHTYQPKTEDLEKMKNFDITFSNGLHMEALMLDQLASLGDKHLAVGEAALDESDLLPWPETDDKGNPLHDPHIWNSPHNWQKVVTVIADRIAKEDPANADMYKENAKAFNEKIEKLHEDAKVTFDKIPKENRFLVTGHDAFNYLGKTYDMEIEATDFVTSEASMSAQQLDELAQKIVDHKIKVIFQDNLKNPQAIQSLKEKVNAKGGDVEVSDHELFADSLGSEPPVDTYLGVFEHNAKSISEALSK